MQIVIGTRGSKLALVQAEYVKERLQKAYPQDEFALKIIKTKGDRIQDQALSQIGDKGLFVREIEKELLEGEIQIAVHSMKDMPSELPEGLCLAGSWEREDPRDVLVLREAESLEQLPEHAVIGTGSKRRACQLLALRPDLNIVNIRGNVGTRIRKMKEEKMDGIVLAAAGLIRLGETSVITQYLEPDQMIPAAAQGTLAIEIRKDNSELLEKINLLSDLEAERVTQTERAFLQQVGAGCQMPVGAFARTLQDGRIELCAIYGDEAGTKLAKCKVVGNDPQDAAMKAAGEILLAF